MKHQIRMKFLAETKGALRYEELNRDGLPITTSDLTCTIGTLYLRKHAMEDDRPKEITVTVEY